MFLGSDIIEFVNKIINIKEVKEEEILTNLKGFVNYLKLTKMADDQTLKCLNHILDCLPEIIRLKNKIGYLDVNMLFKEEEKNNITKSDEKKAKEIVKKYEEKHYHHYHQSSSSSCGCDTTLTGRGC